MHWEDSGRPNAPSSPQTSVRHTVKNIPGGYGERVQSFFKVHTHKTFSAEKRYPPHECG